MSLAAIDCGLLAAMRFVQYIRDQMLFIEWLQRRKNPGRSAPGCQQCWMETGALLLPIIRLFAQPALDISTAFIAGLSGGFGLRMRVTSGTFTRTGLYFLECDRLFFGIIFEKSLQSNGSFGRIDMTYFLSHAVLSVLHNSCPLCTVVVIRMSPCLKYCLELHQKVYGIFRQGNEGMESRKKNFRCETCISGVVSERPCIGGACHRPNISGRTASDSHYCPLRKEEKQKAQA